MFIFKQEFSTPGDLPYQRIRCQLVETDGGYIRMPAILRFVQFGPNSLEIFLQSV